VGGVCAGSEYSLAIDLNGDKLFPPSTQRRLIRLAKKSNKNNGLLFSVESAPHFAKYQIHWLW
jgi:hypothetical protein